MGTGGLRLGGDITAAQLGASGNGKPPGAIGDTLGDGRGRRGRAKGQRLGSGFLVNRVLIGPREMEWHS